jgi:phenylacetate-CoA ligase
MLIIRGVNLYPTQVEEVLKGIPGVVPHYQIVVKRDGTLDEAEVKVEVAEDIFREITQEAWTEDILLANQQMQHLRGSIQHEIRGNIGLNMKVTLMIPGTIPRSEGGKLRRVVDMRAL